MLSDFFSRLHESLYYEVNVSIAILLGCKCTHCISLIFLYQIHFVNKAKYLGIR